VVGNDVVEALGRTHQRRGSSGEDSMMVQLRGGRQRHGLQEKFWQEILVA
jgi:hypothetical protein